MGSLYRMVARLMTSSSNMTSQSLTSACSWVISYLVLLCHEARTLLLWMYIHLGLRVHHFGYLLNVTDEKKHSEYYLVVWKMDTHRWHKTGIFIEMLSL